MPTKQRNRDKGAGARWPQTRPGWVALFVLAAVTVLACATVAIGFSGAAQASQERSNTTQVSTPTPNAAGGAAGNAVNQASPPAPQSTEQAAGTATANASGAGSVATGGPPPLP